MPPQSMLTMAELVPRTSPPRAWDNDIQDKIGISQQREVVGPKQYASVYHPQEPVSCRLPPGP